MHAIAAAISLIAAATSLIAAWPVAAGESEHVAGPGGLVGWKPAFLLDNDNEVSDRLVIHRNGRLLHAIQGSPFIWRWMFRDDGKHIALESGPLHFGMACVLIDTDSGKELERLNCFTYPRNPPPGGWPAWLAELEDMP
jgi:hypothetical protein